MCLFYEKDCVGGSVSVLDLMDVVVDKNDTSSIGFGGSDYFRTLFHQSFPGPLVGGNTGNKELNTWIDERIMKCGSTNLDCRNGELLRLLLSLLKIACQHYGKLRSPFGTDPSLKVKNTAMCEGPYCSCLLIFVVVIFWSFNN